MSIEARIEMIKDSQTEEQAIEAYGLFVEYFEKLEGGVD